MKGGNRRTVSYSRDLEQKVYDDYSDSGSSPIGAGAGSSDECDSISFITALLSIQPALTNHSVGDVLELVIDVSGRVVAQSTFGVCGAVGGSIVTKLKRCLQNGKAFKVVITKLTAVICEVRISTSKS